MKFVRTFVMFSAALMLPIAAIAASPDTASAAKSMPDDSQVTVTGTVEDYDSRHPFTLRDSTGTIQVDLSSAKPIVLHNGQQVTITGDTDKDLFGTEIVATDVKFNSVAVPTTISATTTMEPLPTRAAAGASQTANATEK